jgi:hypothetical protein
MRQLFKTNMNDFRCIFSALSLTFEVHVLNSVTLESYNCKLNLSVRNEFLCFSVH